MRIMTTDMEYRALGKCGTRVSVFGLGGWTTFGELLQDKHVARNLLIGAIEAGINFFDIADVYANGRAERMMGDILREFPRHRLVITSKVFHPMSKDVNDRGLSRKHIMESVERSLDRIGTDYLDIYFCHRFDEETPLEETVRAMDDLVHQGKILYWGTSEWTGQQLRDAYAIADKRNLYAPQVEQPQYSLLVRNRFETDTFHALNETGMGSVIWSPLASGLLTGKYDDGIPQNSRFARIEWIRNWFQNDDRTERVRKFRTLADEAGCSRAQLALAWAASQPGVSSVITGASHLDQLKENLGALRIEITEEMRTELDTLFPTNEMRM